MKKKGLYRGGGIALAVLAVAVGSHFMNMQNTESGGKALESLYQKQTEETSESDILGSVLEVEEELDRIYNVIESRMLTRTEKNGDKWYEDYYAGAYIEENKLIVCVTDMEHRADFGEDLLKEDSIEWDTVEFSYNQMHEYQKELTCKYEEYYKDYDDGETKEGDLLSSIVGFGIDVSKNTLYVNVQQLTKEKEDTFASLFGKKEFVSFRNTDYIGE